MSGWRIEGTQESLRLASVNLRAFGAERFTWAELLYSLLDPVRVYILYFPSRFDLPLDAAATDALRAFGQNTPASTSVNFWDPTDPEFDRALALFDLKAPPALVFVSGLRLKGMDRTGPKQAPLYAVAVGDPGVLGDPERLAPAANAIHALVERGNPKEINRYVRERRLDALLDAIGALASGLRDQVLKLKPSLHAPGGFSIQLG